MRTNNGSLPLNGQPSDLYYRSTSAQATQFPHLPLHNGPTRAHVRSSLHIHSQNHLSILPPPSAPLLFLLPQLLLPPQRLICPLFHPRHLSSLCRRCAHHHLWPPSCAGLPRCLFLTSPAPSASTHTIQATRMRSLSSCPRVATRSAAPA